MLNNYSVYWIRRKIHNDPMQYGYIGVSHNPQQRFIAHSRGRNNKNKTVVTKAIAKYDDIVIDILVENISKEDAISIEKEYRPKEKIGWNICVGGGIPPSRSGSTTSEETRLKQSSSLKGKIKSEEHLRNISNSLKGRPPGNAGTKRKIVKCPHCNKTGGINTMMQWHFDKCKHGRS